MALCSFNFGFGGGLGSEKMPKRTDGTQTAIVAAIRQIGGEWVETSADPRAGCDGIVLYRGRSLVAEIKNGELPPSARKLTDNEQKTKAKCEARGVPYLILLSPIQAIETLSEFH